MINAKQLKALRYLITQSKDASFIAKEVAIFFLNNSESLTKDVYACFTPASGFSKIEVKEIHNGIHNMLSSNGSTFLTQIFQAAGSELSFQHCCGAYDASGKHDHTIKDAVTIWLCSGPSKTNSCEHLLVNRKFF
jgi:hypothetical protein